MHGGFSLANNVNVSHSSIHQCCTLTSARERETTDTVVRAVMRCVIRRLTKNAYRGDFSLASRKLARGKCLPKHLRAGDARKREAKESEERNEKEEEETRDDERG